MQLNYRSAVLRPSAGRYSAEHILIVIQTRRTRDPIDDLTKVAIVTLDDFAFTLISSSLSHGIDGANLKVNPIDDL